MMLVSGLAITTYGGPPLNLLRRIGDVKVLSALLGLAFALAYGVGPAIAQQDFEVRHLAGAPGGLGSADGFASAARFRYPADIWGDGTYLYVADQEGSAIRRITIATAEVRLIAGSITEPGYQDGIGTAARFKCGGGLWGDSVYLYIADRCNLRIRRMNLSTQAVETIAGQDFPVMTDGAISQATFQGPLDVWGDGRFLYVADDGAYGFRGLARPGALRRIDLATDTVTTISVPGLPPRNSVPRRLWGDERELFIAYDQGLIVAMDLATNTFRVVADLNTPDVSRAASGMWSRADNFLYVVASSAELLRINTSTGEIRSLFGLANYRDWLDGSGSQARLRNPAGIWGDGDRLYISDSGNHVIGLADLGTSVLRTFAGTGLRVADASLPDSPAGVSWGDGTYLYFSASNRIWKIPIGGGSAAVVAGTGIPGSRNGPSGVAQFNDPQAIWGDGTYLFVNDKGNHTIRKVQVQTGDVTTLAGSPGEAGQLDGVAGDARLAFPEDLWGDDRYLYLTDLQLLRRITLETGAVETVAGGPNPSALSTDGIGLSARFLSPKGIWGDGTSLYVVDASHVRRMSLETFSVTTLSQFNHPSGLWWGGDMWGDGINLYVVAAYEIQRLSLASDEVSTIAGGPTPGRDDGIGSQARFYGPRNVWGIGSTLFVADDGRLRAVDIPSGAVETIAGRKTIDADGVGLAARFNGPTGIWGDGKNLYVTDRYANTVRQIDLQTRKVQTVAGFTGEAGVSDGVGDHARFREPQGICGDGTALYVASNGAVRKITLGTWEVSTLATGGSAGLWCSEAAIYVADTYGQAIRRIDLATKQVTTVVSGLVGPTHIWGEPRFLYFSNQFGRSIMRLNLATSELTTLVERASLNLGGGNFWGDDAYLYVPFGNSIRRLNKSTGEMTGIAGDETNFGTEDGEGKAARFWGPNSIWGDGNTLYVTDSGNHAIRTITLAAAPANASVIALELAPYGTVSRTTVDAGQPLRVGYARIQPDGGGTAPAGMAVFGFHSQGVLVSETTVPAVGPILAGRIYAETTGIVRTGVAIANPNPQAVSISFYFTDGQGQSFGSATAVIEANQQIAGFLDERPFSNPALLQRPISEARAFTFSASLPVAAIALRGFINERGEFLMTTLPVADLSRSSPETVIIPHFAQGGGWTTEVALVNPSDAEIAGTLRFFDPVGISTGTQNYRIVPRSSVTVRKTSTDPVIRIGSIHVVPQSGQRPPVGLNIFSYMTNGITVTQTGVPTSGTASVLNIYAEKVPGLRSAFALANAGSQSVAIQFDVISSEGRLNGIHGVLNLSGNGQRTLFLDELPGAEALPETFKGVLRVSAPAGAQLSAIGLRSRINERGDFLVSTTVPYLDSADSTAELDIPHFVDGGGYATEFILLGGNAAPTRSDTLLNFYSQSGQRLPLIIR